MNVILTPKNWATFQHYKDRSPAWIKLHRGLLDDYDYQCLPVASKALAPMLWLLASEHDHGRIDTDTKKLAFRLRMDEGEFIDALKPLIQSGFFTDARGLLADCKREASLEKEREREKEEEREEEREGECRGTQVAVPKKRAAAPTDEAIEVRRSVFEGYSNAYADRYGVHPLRNAKTNALIAQFCRLVPADEAPAVAAHYVGHNGQFYVAKMHPLELLVADANKLRTEWATGVSMTTTRARQQDRTSSMLSIVEEIKRERGEA